VRQTHRFHPIAPLLSLSASICAAKPDLIIPGDDTSVRHLHHLYVRERGRKGAGESISQLIERSLGSPRSYPVVFERTSIIELARQHGIRVPRTAVVKNTIDLGRRIEEFGLPLVLKANGTSGGEGVRIAQSLADAERAFHELEVLSFLDVVRQAKRTLVQQDKTFVWSSLFHRRTVVNAQEYIEGTDATSAVACWKGKVLAGLHFDVLSKQYSVGPASVVRVTEDADMPAASEKLVRCLGLSGLHGFDFVREARTGKAYLVEMNPRATQVGHLTLGPRRDLPTALYAAVSGEEIQEAPRLTENDTITLFPQECLKNPASEYLESGYHDVPWSEPELIRDYVRVSQSQIVRFRKQQWVQELSADRLPRPDASNG
jgi:predicted ATP-grasp superfamily ATP-dependent carboligase